MKIKKLKKKIIVCFYDIHKMQMIFSCLENWKTKKYQISFSLLFNNLILHQLTTVRKIWRYGMIANKKTNHQRPNYVHIYQ